MQPVTLGATSLLRRSLLTVMETTSVGVFGASRPHWCTWRAGSLGPQARPLSTCSVKGKGRAAGGHLVALSQDRPGCITSDSSPIRSLTRGAWRSAARSKEARSKVLPNIFPTILARLFSTSGALLAAVQRRYPHRPPSSSSGSSRGSFLSPLVRRFNSLPNSFVLYALIGLNIGVFVAWQYASDRMRKMRDPRAYIFMSRNFLTGEANLMQGRFWTLVTSCVSHEDTTHLFVNMLSLGLMGSAVIRMLGNTTFLGLYFGAGLASATISTVWHRYIDPWIGRRDAKVARLPSGSAQAGSYSHGASGSVYAIISTFACMAPRAQFLIFFVIPAPAWACVSGIFAWDLWQAWFRPGGRTDSAGHLGGIVGGILFWRFRLRGRTMYY